MAKLAESEGISSSGLSRINNVLMQMRKNCNHPDLITSSFTADLHGPPVDVMLAQSGKLALLDRLLKKLKAGGHKVLIFSQVGLVGCWVGRWAYLWHELLTGTCAGVSLVVSAFASCTRSPHAPVSPSANLSLCPPTPFQMTKMLDILHDYIDGSGHKVCRLDGSVPYQQRQEQIESFNSDPNTWLFLLSTRAGGLGINLTAADTVIIYDSDWNPCADLQVG
jgi:SNF2 family DNA or RNA helicase